MSIKAAKDVRAPFAAISVSLVRRINSPSGVSTGWLWPERRKKVRLASRIRDLDALIALSS
jgi:hypothetical protein